MSQISRLKSAEIANGNLINADDLNAELDQLVSESNDQDARLATVESGTITLGGTKTFTAAPKIDQIAERTAGAGLSVTNLKLTPEAGFTPTVNGQIGYDATAHAYGVMVDGAARTLYHEGNLVEGKPRGYLFGLLLSNNATDAEHDLDIAAGTARDDSDSVNLNIPALTKQLDASWVVGTGAGGFASGESLPTSGTVHVWAIAKADGADADIFFNDHATSGLTPTLPTDYLYKRRIGSLRTDSSANLIGFFQHGDQFLLTSPVLDINASDGTTAALRTLSTPTGLKLEALLNVMSNSGSGGDVATYISSPDAADLAASTTAAPLGSIGTYSPSNSRRAAGQVRVITNTSSQVRSRSDNTNTLRIATLGWIDNRGRLA